MICNECETVAHCMKNGCVPKTTKKEEAMKLALEALEVCEQHGYIPVRLTREAITALRETLAEQPTPVQQEPDLSGLKPSTQEAIKGWIEDGTFIERAIGAMQAQETENMRLEKLVAEQPAQQEPVAWIWKYSNGEEEVVFVPPRHVDATHMDAPSTITPLYTSPPAQRKPLTNLEGLKLAYKHHWLTSLTLRDAYILGIRDAEAAHGIKENT